MVAKDFSEVGHDSKKSGGREIPGSLAWATRSERTQEEKVLRGEDGEFYKPNISLFHTAPKVHARPFVI